VLADDFHGRPDRAQVGAALGAQGSRHADDRDGRLGQDRCVGGRAEARFAQRRDVGVTQIVDVGTALVEAGDCPLADVETDDREAGAGGGLCERQARGLGASVRWVIVAVIGVLP